MAESQLLAQQRCGNHPMREAAARCQQCRDFFCRECVTEHGERLVCAACLRRLASTPGAPSRRRLAGLGIAARAAFGVLTAWFYFYLIGQMLLLIPSSFHATGSVAGHTSIEEPANAGDATGGDPDGGY